MSRIEPEDRLPMNDSGHQLSRSHATISPLDALDTPNRGRKRSKTIRLPNHSPVASPSKTPTGISGMSSDSQDWETKNEADLQKELANIRLRNKKRRELYPKNPLDWEKIYGTYICVVDRPNANRVFETSDVVGNTVEDIAMSLGLNPDRFMVDNGFFKYRVDRTCFVVDECPFLILNERPEQYPPPKCYLEFIWNDAAGDSLLNSLRFYIDLFDERDSIKFPPLCLSLKQNEVTDQTDVRDIIDKTMEVLGISGIPDDDVSLCTKDGPLGRHTKLRDLFDVIIGERLRFVFRADSNPKRALLEWQQLYKGMAKKIKKLQKRMESFQNGCREVVGRGIWSWCDVNRWCRNMDEYCAILNVFGRRLGEPCETYPGMFLLELLPVLRKYPIDRKQLEKSNMEMKETFAKAPRSKVKGLNPCNLDRFLAGDDVWLAYLKMLCDKTPSWHPDYPYLRAAIVEIEILLNGQVCLPRLTVKSSAPASIIQVPCNMRSDIKAKREIDQELRKEEVAVKFLTSLDGWEKAKTLGGGEYGQVVLYVSKQSGEKIAVKQTYLGKETFEECCQREAEALQRFRHPCIVKFRGAFIGDQKFCVCMEYVDHGSLVDVIKNDSLDTDKHTKLAIILTGIVIGMQEIHSKNLIHCDLKPENVLLDKNYYPKISHFGTCRDVEENYRDPEVPSENCHWGADIFSFGAILQFVMVSADREQKSELASPSLQERLDCPQWVRELIAATWTEDLDDQYNSFDDIFLAMEENDFKFWDDVDAEKVHEYLCAVECPYIKIVHALDDAETFEKEMTREIRVRKTLEHPCLLRLIDGRKVDDREYRLASQRMANGFLDCYSLGNGSAPSRLYDHTTLAKIIVGIAVGLEHMHACGCVHGRLHPRNVLLDENMLPKLTDFGSGTSCAHDSPDADLYLAPDDSRNTEMGDVYSFGVLLWTIVSNADKKEESRPPPLSERTENSFMYPDCDLVSAITEWACAISPADRFDNFTTALALMQKDDFKFWNDVDSAAVQEYYVSLYQAVDYRVSLDGLKRIKSLNSGYFGSVYLYEDADGNQYAVKKTPRKAGMADPCFFSMLGREISILKRYQFHPCLLRIRGSMLKDKGMPVYYMITDYCSNGNIFQAVQNRSPWLSNHTHVVLVIVGIVLGVRQLHRHGHIHRDLKPENILLDEKNLPKVADFGTAREEQRYAMTVCGTPLYQAPEMDSRKDMAVYTRSVDVFSFAMILWVILFGDLGELTRAQSQGGWGNGCRPGIPEWCPNWLNSLINRSWATDPRDRTESFDKILTEMRDNHFKIWDDVDEEQVLSFISDVEAIEASRDFRSDK